VERTAGEPWDPLFREVDGIYIGADIYCGTEAFICPRGRWKPRLAMEPRGSMVREVDGIYIVERSVGKRDYANVPRGR
jgi:hypothetical protein